MIFDTAGIENGEGVSAEIVRVDLRRRAYKRGQGRVRGMEEASLERGDSGAGAFAEGTFCGVAHDTPDFGTFFGALREANELRDNLDKA